MTDSKDEGWAGLLGEQWLRALDVQEAMLAAIGERLLAAADIRPGETVLEIGSGGGWLSRQIAKAVGPSGQVTGLDISPALLDEAQKRGRDLPQLRYELGDAATARPEGAPFDRLISRFGVMFFADPSAGFRHLASLLKPGARLDFVCWADPERNLWASEVRGVMARHTEVPQPATDPRAPGQFQLADADFLRASLTAAGLVDCSLHQIDDPMIFGPDPKAASELVMHSMGHADRVAELGDAARQALMDDLQQMFAGHQTAGGVAMPAAWWLVSARTAG